MSVGTEELKKQFAGFDDQGNPVFDGGNGQFNSLDKSQFTELTKELQTEQPNKKFSTHFSDYQANEITKQNKYLGQDAQGNSVFQNASGIIDKAKGSFSEGLKRKFGDVTFDKSQVGYSNQKLGENEARAVNVNNQVGMNTNANVNTKKFGTPQLASQQPAPPTPTNTSRPESKIQQQFGTFDANKKIQSSINNTQPQQKQPKPQLPQLPQLPQVQQAQQQVQQQVNQQVKPQVQQAQQQVNQQVNQAKTYGQNLLNQYVPQNSQMADTLKQGKDIYSNAQDFMNMANQFKDPRQAAIEYAKQQASQKLGDLVNQGLQQSGFTDQMNQMGYGDLSSKAGSALVGSLLQGGNIAKNLENAAIQQSKDALVNKGIQTAATSTLGNTALSSVPGGAGAIAAGLQGFLGGDNAQDRGAAASKAAAMAAAQAALAGSTMGLSYLVNPDTLNMASGLTDKLSNKVDNWGVVGKPLGNVLDVGSFGLKNAANALGGAMDVVGGFGGDTFNSINKTFKGAKDSVKKLTQGDILGGLGGLGSTALKGAFENLIKNPANMIGNAGKAVGNFVKGLFCFEGDTLIVMEDGSTKRIDEIKVGDKIMLGGFVKLISEGLTQDMYDYNGVIVSGGHAVLEDGKWTRVSDSKDGKNLERKEPTMVYTLATEHHLIMTADYQVWSDVEEVEDTFNKTDDDIIKELNASKKLNKILETKTAELKDGNS
jgi:hypothetical protein